MRLIFDYLKFVWLLRKYQNRKRWKHAKNYSMYWRFFVKNYNYVPPSRIPLIKNLGKNL